MKYSVLTALLLVSLAWNAVAQKDPSHIRSNRHNKDGFPGRSHIEVDLGQRNTLLIGFDTYAQVRARRNIDSVLRLFLTDYRKVADQNEAGTRAVHAFFRLAESDRALDLRFYPQPTASFRLSDSSDPVLLKTQQDTLHVVWRTPETAVNAPAQAYDFHVYLFLNKLADVERLTREGVNARLMKALEAVEQYKAHDLTSPKMAFDLVQPAGKAPEFINPGSARSPSLIISPSLGVGLVRNQWVPSAALDLQFVPSRQRNVAYTVGYLSNFFFQPTTDGGHSSFRNDFINVGVTFYRNDLGNGRSSFSRVLAGFSVGMPVYRRGSYFDRNTIRLSGTVFHQGLIKIQPEIYMKGAFRNVYPGVRLTVGL